MELERDSKIGKLSENKFVEQKLEILAALKRLDEDLSSEEKLFFENHSTNSMKEFVQVQEGSMIQDGAKILSMAKKWFIFKCSKYFLNDYYFYIFQS